MEYIIDPNDPEISYDKSVNSYPLENGMISLESPIENSYVPITLSLNKELLEIYSNKIAIVEGIKSILKPLINFYLDSPVAFVDIVERKDAYIFSPSTTLSAAVFKNSNYITDFISKTDPNQFIGYTLFSTSSLARYIIEEWADEYPDLKIKYFSTPKGYLSLIPISSLSPYTDSLMDRFAGYLPTLIKQGYFAYNFGMHDVEDMELIRELCMLYDITIVNTKDLFTWILKTDVDFKVSPEDWLRYNLPIVKTGSFPSYSIYISLSYFNDYQRLYGTVFKDVVLKYITHLSFADLSDDYPFIAPYINKIRINQDFSITVFLPTYSLVKKLKSSIIEHLNKGFYSLDKKTKNGPWNIETCKDLREGILKRWMVQKVDEDAYPMVFLDNTNTEILIHRSPLGIKFPSRFKFDEEEAERTLREELKKYYKKCHDNIEPVSLDQINEMDLDDLLNLIPVLEKGITYCFSSDTINALVKKENPLTRRPLSEKALWAKRYLEEGWRGLFDIGPLYGLYESVPTKVDVKTERGVIQSVRRKTSLKKRKLVGNLFDVTVLFEDGTTSPLFQISLPTVGLERIDQMREVVEDLWYEGYFLNDWMTAINVFLDLKSFPVFVTNPVLLRAGDSIFDGNTALEMMLNKID